MKSFAVTGVCWVGICSKSLAVTGMCWVGVSVKSLAVTGMCSVLTCGMMRSSLMYISCSTPADLEETILLAFYLFSKCIKVI